MFATFVAALVASAGVIAAPACALVLPPSNLTARASISSPLFPVSPQKSYWTTDPDLPNPTPPVRCHLPSSQPDHRSRAPGGFSFYAPAPRASTSPPPKEATLGYTVYFPAGFDFVKGGKLPGLCA
ncbi:hypothetical protein NUW54_g13286 [Trametes sanguinea]|uniref:Uncharacterized protein n=1 Tax=Trametes sanguinea TaxID=158606 RepID=A0ACC1MNF9_9APHY|nr:hypothetical protein NUW54_g13286 [Trametes sanguinea]